jgi:hypothetical protein
LAQYRNMPEMTAATKKVIITHTAARAHVGAVDPVTA